MLYVHCDTPPLQYVHGGTPPATMLYVHCLVSRILFPDVHGSRHRFVIYIGTGCFSVTGLGTLLPLQHPVLSLNPEFQMRNAGKFALLLFTNCQQTLKIQNETVHVFLDTVEGDPAKIRSCVTSGVVLNVGGSESCSGAFSLLLRLRLLRFLVWEIQPAC